jgi:2-succinyl-6-hydroxy-2,4-cyclohexadiene-1-carboxylate synthase
VTFFGLHGFLGLPSDMDFLPEGSVCPNLFEEPFLKPFDEFIEIFEGFAKKVPGKKILVGYSMGGRLALQVLDKKRDLFDAAVIISANPFGEEERLEKDLLLAKDFLLKPWDELMASWENRPLFKKPIDRLEKDFNRKALAYALDVWSLGRQKTIFLEGLEVPILFVTGDEDLKYRDIGRRVVLTHRLSKKQVIEGASHRVFVDAPEKLKEVMLDFFASIT